MTNQNRNSQWPVVTLILGIFFLFFGLMASLGWAEVYRNNKPCVEANAKTN